MRRAAYQYQIAAVDGIIIDGSINEFKSVVVIKADYLIGAVARAVLNKVIGIRRERYEIIAQARIDNRIAARILDGIVGGTADDRDV